jgi:outer membrane receptor protein involved in Fe transport
MRGSTKFILLAGCATTMSCVSSAAIAQDATTTPVSSPAAPAPAGAAQAAPMASPTPGSNGGGVAEIVVTANKREQNLNKVGLTITAISGADLAERKITSLADVAAAVPGLSFAHSADNTPILTLRGIGFNESALGVYPAVSVYMDQAPLPFPVLASHSSYDLQRVEVLKGPQGTLFGQNSTGGAINYVASAPTDKLEGGADLSYGRFNDVEGNAYISGPVTDRLKARVAVSGQNEDGWQISNTRPYDRNGRQSYVAGRFLANWEASDRLRFTLNLNGWIDRSQPQAAQFILLNPQTPSTVLPQELAYPLTRENPRAADWSTGIGTPRSDRKFYQTALRTDFDVTDDVTLTALTSYDHFTQKQTTDGDGSALAISDLTKDDGYIHSFNQEVRISNAARSSFRWVLGGNYESSHTYEDQNLLYTDDSNNSAPLGFIHQDDQFTKQSIRNYAIFGNAEYDLTSKLTIKGGVRYTNSLNHAQLCEVDLGDGDIAGLFNSLGEALGTVPFTPVGTTGPRDGRCTSLNSNLVPGGSVFQSKLAEHNVSWRVGADYKLNPDTLLYANVSRGYKAGSYPVLAAGTETQYKPVTQESVTAYEAGIKAGFLDRRVHVNAAGFYYDYKNKQILGKEVDPIFGILDTLVNVPKSRVFGFDGDISVIPVHGLTLTGSLTYLNSKITKYDGTNAIGEATDFNGQHLPFAPKWNYGINADYRYSMASGGTPFVGVSVLGKSLQDTAVGGRDITIPASPVVRLLAGVTHPFTTNAYATVDARIGYEAPGGAWRVMVYGRNIFNKYYWTNVVTASDASARYAGLPATYGITVGVKFK